MSSGPLLLADSIVKRFGGLTALDGATVEAGKGLFVILAGPNGSGKTTLLNVISGLYKPDGGKVVFEGRDVTKLPPYARARLGIARTFQTPRFAGRLTVLDNVIFGHMASESPLDWRWARREAELAERAFRYLEMVKLDHLWDHPAAELSGGQMKLMELARALMAGAKLVLMDEPAAGINPTLAHELFSVLREVTRSGVSLLVVEHRLDIAADYADYMYVLHNGKVISRGPPQQVLKDPVVVEAFLA